MNNMPITEKEILRQIIVNSSDPILIASKTAEIIYVNPAWEKLTGYSFEEVLGKNSSILKSGKTSRIIYKRMWHNLMHKKSFTSDKFIDRKKNGTTYQIRSNIYPIIKNNEVIYYVQLQHDITAERKLEDLRRELLYTSAHEFKTPLTVLKLLTQSYLLKAKQRGKKTIHLSDFKLIDQELDKLIRMIDDMLDSSRFETGKQFMMYQEVDLSKLITTTLHKTQIYAPTHKIITKDLLTNIKVIADPMRIEQVLLNLLSNAIKYSPNGKPIIVSLKRDNDHAIVSVSDNGIGIPKNKQKFIFDRYYRIKTNSNVGFGLGLYISKEIIKRHKGKIWVESENGKGSTFFFSLPIYYSK